MRATALETTAPARRAAATPTLADLVCLTKARLNSLVSLTVVAGAVLVPDATWAPAALAACGATLAALGACALNQVLERARDARMMRTRARPLPAGRLDARAAAAIAVGLLAAGCLLAAAAGPVPAALTALGGALYALVYTPLKGRTPLAFAPGALAGALPPLVGWTAAGGDVLAAPALLLLALLLAWQVPHVAAIDWVHRDDHARGGLRTLAVVDPTGRGSGLAALLGAGLLVVASAALAAASGGWPAALVAAGLSLPLVRLARALQRARTSHAGRRLFVATLAQLPAVLLVAIVAGRL